MREYMVVFTNLHKASRTDRDFLMAASVEWHPDLVVFYGESGQIVAQYNRAHVAGVRDIDATKPVEPS